jgi:hypothetical protein
MSKGPEDVLQHHVIELAHLLGWKIAHFRPAKTAHGWRTAVSADGAGFPDLELHHPQYGTMWVELKAGKAKLRVDQEAWRDIIVAAGGRWHLWTTETPLALIAQELRDPVGTSIAPAGRWPHTESEEALFA